MKFFKLALVALILLVNLCLAQPSLADAGKFIKSADYTEVTQAIETLLQSKDKPNSGLTAADVQQKFADLQLQKYILETSSGRARCRNATGKNLAVYLKPKKAPDTQLGTLYYLGNGQITDDDFTCLGIYLPAETQLALSLLSAVNKLAEPIALKIVQGTQLTVTADPKTGVLAFNIPPAQLFKSGDAGWAIPTLTQADIDAQRPNVPQD